MADSHHRGRVEVFIVHRRETESRHRDPPLDEPTIRDQELGLQYAIERLTALFDANILCPAGLRDPLMYIEDRYVFAVARIALPMDLSNQRRACGRWAATCLRDHDPRCTIAEQAFNPRLPPRSMVLCLQARPA